MLLLSVGVCDTKKAGLAPAFSEFILIPWPTDSDDK